MAITFLVGQIFLVSISGKNIIFFFFFRLCIVNTKIWAIWLAKRTGIYRHVLVWKWNNWTTKNINFKIWTWKNDVPNWFVLLRPKIYSLTCFSYFFWWFLFCLILLIRHVTYVSQEKYKPYLIYTFFHVFLCFLTCFHVFSCFLVSYILGM